MLSLKSNLHVSWLIANASAGILAGVALALITPVNMFSHWLFLAGALGLLLFAIKWRNLFVCGLWISSGILAGLWLGANELANKSMYEPFYDQQVVVTGQLVADSKQQANKGQQFWLKEVSVNDRRLSGKIWVNTSSQLSMRQGDRVTILGKLDQGFGNAAASIFRAKITAAETPQPPDPALMLRDKFIQSIKQAIPSPEAELGIGFLTGYQATLPSHLEEQLQNLGLAHIVVASGYNLTILVMLARRTLAKISKYLATLCTGLLIVGFISITGLSPSMVRAGMVASLGLAAWYYGRTVHPVVLLLFVAAITVLLDPTLVWGDLGWYLSFISFAGVLILAPLLHKFFWGDKKPGALREILIATIGAQIATFPLVVFFFGQYSLLALPANILILPFVPIAMLLSFIGGLSGLFMPTIASYIGTPAYGLLHFMVSVINWLTSLTDAKIEFNLTPVGLGLSYIALTGLTAWLWRKTKFNFRQNLVD